MSKTQARSPLFAKKATSYSVEWIEEKWLGIFGYKKSVSAEKLETRIEIEAEFAPDEKLFINGVEVEIPVREYTPTLRASH